MTRPLLSIIVPCLNEQSNICQAIDLLISATYSIDTEIIVVDDQSDDSTHDVVTQHVKRLSLTNVKVFRKPLSRRGYGSVIKYGIAYASGTYILPYSADMVDPLDQLPYMLDKASMGSDVVQVSRYIDTFNSRTIPFKYKFFQFFYRISVFLCLGKYLPDSTYAFKLFDRRKILCLGLSSNRFSISPEILFKSFLAGYKVSFLSASQSVRSQGVSKFHFTKEGPGFFHVLLRTLLHRSRLMYWF